MDFNIADSDPFFNDTLCAGTVCVYCERDQEGELIPVTFCCSLSCDEDGNVQGSRGSSSTPGASVYDEHYGSSGEGCAEVFGNYQDVGTGNQWDDLDRHEYNQGIVTATGFGFAAGAAGAVITGAGAPAAGGVGIVTGLGSGLTVASAGPSGHETKCCP